MRESSFIDTNIFLRFLTADVPEQSIRSKALIESLEKGSIEAITSDLVFAELVWVLESFYSLTHREIYQKLYFLINLRGLKVLNKGIILEALDTYASINVDFIDAYNAAFMRQHNISSVYSYDRDFDKLHVRRNEP